MARQICAKTECPIHIYSGHSFLRHGSQKNLIWKVTTDLHAPMRFPPALTELMRTLVAASRSRN